MKIFKLIINPIIKLGMLASGSLAITTQEPIAVVISGLCAIASVISSSIKDRNPKLAIEYFMKIVNAFACNIDKAKNEKNKNI